MKKTVVTMMVLVSLVMGMNAQAELRMKPYCQEVSKAAVLHDGTVVWDTIYYAKVSTDTSETVMEVSKEEYEALMSEYKANDPDLAAPKQKSFFGKVASVATFWNPND